MIVDRMRALYQAEGYDVRVQPEQRGAGACCPALWRGDVKLDTGLGISDADIQVFEQLSKTFAPTSIFGVGNGFGWSTMAMALLWPTADICVLDACIEGKDSLIGIELTRRLLYLHTVLGVPDMRVMLGFSPQDVPMALDASDPVELVFIDGQHTNEQMWADYESVRPFLADQHILLFHDVEMFGMQRSWLAVSANYPGRSRLLPTPTGMGVVWTGGIGANL